MRAAIGGLPTICANELIALCTAHFDPNRLLAITHNAFLLQHNGNVIPAQAGIQVIGKEANMERQPCVYLLASERNGTLYTGVTSNLLRRVWEHKQNLVEGFTHKYHINRLVWYELHETMVSAISREKAIKKWNRAWKIRVIEEKNPRWNDLYDELMNPGFPPARE